MSDGSPGAPLSRRDLLKSAGLAGAAFAIPAGLHAAEPASEPPPPASAPTMMDVPFERHQTVRVGIVGTGLRGSSVLGEFLSVPGVRVTALCDIVPAKVDRAAKRVTDKGQPMPAKYTNGERDFEHLVARDDVDFVYTATPWPWHTPVMLAALKAGKHCGTEVPAATSKEECWALVDASEKVRRHCLIMENCCYDFNEMLVDTMVKRGMFGELLYAEAAYIHDLRALLFEDKDEGLWRRLPHTNRQGNFYPTHGLGPVAWYLDIHKGDRFDYLVSMSTQERGLSLWREAHVPKDSPKWKETYIEGDINSSLIKTVRGKTILLQHAVTTPTPYDRLNSIRGTKGVFKDYPARFYLDGTRPESFKPIDSFKTDYTHPLWQRLGAQAKVSGGEGGMDYILITRLMECMQQGLPPDINVYDAAAWSAPWYLSEASVKRGSMPMQFPDFTRDHWRTPEGGRMNPTWLDWSIVVASIIICLIPALFYLKKGGSSTAEFFTSGRAAPWWLLGVSMVATTFSTDTPNLVTNFVRTGGVAANWQWWAFLLTGMATVFFFARLWRRSGVLTDLEFYEIRYSGKAASAVRGFRAIYLGLIFNCGIMASVNLAAAKIANIVLGWPMWQTLLICATLNVVFAAIAGLWGVLVIDFIQFGIAMTGAFAAAHYALAQPAVGGLSGLVAHLPAATLNLLPDFSNWTLTLSIFIIPLTVQWWSVWYPGAEPGGGSYIAQRMLAARSERDALGGTLLFNTAHYALRSWPWIIVALASIIIFPTLDSIRSAFPLVDPKLVGHDMAYPAMLKFLPHGMLGLMIAAMEAAYRSTIMTHLNWGSSYLVNDFWKRFIKPNESERHYVMMGRLSTALLVALAAALTYALDTAADTFNLLLSIGAGTGLLYLLRWFWWRINAWCEIAAMVSSFVIAVAFFVAGKMGHPVDHTVSLLITVGATTVVWIATAFLTPGTDRATLLSFYRKVRPSGPGWADIRAEAGVAAAPDSLPQAFLAWMLGLMMVYGALFATGSFLYGRSTIALFWTATFVVGTGGLLRIVPRMWSSAGAG